MSQKMKYYDQEKLDIIALIRKYKSIIECKESYGSSNIEKTKAWNEILKEYNATHIRKRTLLSIQNFWTHQKTMTRKNYAILKQETHRTGGGVNTATLSEIDNKTLEILQSISVEGMHNKFDCDVRENMSPNDPVFEFLLQENEIESWSKCQTPQLRSPLSTPLEEAIAGTFKIHTSQNQEPVVSHLARKKPKLSSSSTHQSGPGQSSDSYKSTKEEVFNLMKENLKEKKGLEQKLLKKQIKREDLQLRLLKRKLTDNDVSVSSSDTD